jgi:3D (Asp-Asp-Asp) domain-containing protein
MACILLADNNLKQMIRYFYCSCFLIIGMGLPLSAKNTGTDNPTPSTSSKAGTKAIPSSSPVAQAKEGSQKKSEIIVTPDISRGAVSPSLVAKQETVLSTPTRTLPSEKPTGSEASTLITRYFSTMTYATGTTPVRTESGPVRTESNPGQAISGERLARVTAYWAGEGDYYTGRCISATGVHLHDGHCAVDPNIIPYGSVVEIAGVGKYLAVDTGSAVISRTAAKEGGHTAAERSAIVVDLFFEDASEGEKFAASAAKYVSISWWTPTSMASDAKAARSLFAEEDWSKIQSKQL